MSLLRDSAWMEQIAESLNGGSFSLGAEEVECVVCDLAGTSRGKSMPASKFSPDNHYCLPVSIFYQAINGDDVDMNIENQWAETDMLLVPDMSTRRSAPWGRLPTMQVIADLYWHDQEPVSYAPRHVLRRVIAAYHEVGLQPIVAPELEFYLTSPNTDPNEPIMPPPGRSGRQSSGRQSYSMMAVEEYGPVIDTLYDFAEKAGLTIDTLTQEDGPGQLEINLPHGDPLKLADQVFFFKRLIREAAFRHGLFATFMAKPMREQPGSAMHLHQSVGYPDREGTLFATESGEESPAFHHFLGGLQRYLPAAFPMLAPYVNSFRRFEVNSSAPTNLAWGYENRATGLRVPHSASDSRRIENRLIGIDCNPYLAIAASLACGLLGLREKIPPGQPEAGEVDWRNHALPHSMAEGLKHLAVSRDFRDLMGEEFCRIFESVKWHELRQYRREISPWERQHLLLSV